MNPFQRHSETSKIASERTNSLSARQRILKVLTRVGTYGATADDLAIELDMGTNTVAARLRGLYLDNKVKKTTETRMTILGCPANIWKLAQYVSIDEEAQSKRDKARQAHDIIKKRLEGLHYSSENERKFLTHILEILE